MPSKSELLLQGGDDVSPIVIDVGCHTTRVGYGQEDSPRRWWNSVCGKHLNYTDDNGSQKLLFPVTFYWFQESLEVKPCLFMQGGRYSINSDVFERIVQSSVEGQPIQSTYPQGLHMDDEEPHTSCIGGLGERLAEHPALLSEPSKHSDRVRETMSEVMFEKFQVPALYLAKQAVLSAFAIGRPTGLVVDIGASGMTITPVTEGFAMQKSLYNCPVGGDLLDSHILSSLLAESNANFSPYYGRKHAARNGIGKANPTGGDGSELLLLHPSYLQHSRLEAARNLKESVCKVRERSAATRKAESTEKSDPKQTAQEGGPKNGGAATGNLYELPDGTQVDTSNYEYNIGELLFHPQLMRLGSIDERLQEFKGLPKAITDCVLNCDIDLRRDMLNAIILTGGTTLIPGLVERVNQSLHEDESLFSSSVKFKILSTSTAVERRFGAWLGGSILSSLGTFQQLWISRQEYVEYGMRILGKRCS